ncbi:MAG: hypothetical protein M1405_03520 [Patescibacteria group bacterium]|nr:hypothetical protein [Patescibacteria group bacterium]
MFLKSFKSISVILLIVLAAVYFTKPVNAQVMNGSYPQVTPSAQDISDINEGKSLFNNVKNNIITCLKLKDADFEKIGEYVMNQRFADTQAHIQMNLMAKQMMGENGEEQMHIILGKQVTGCNINNPEKGGVQGMMGNYANMMGLGNAGMMGFGGFGLFWVLPLVLYIVVIIDFILLGFWLWKQLKKK